MNIQEMSDEQLWQALKDIEDEGARIRMEISARGEKAHPGLFKAVGVEIRRALNSPSMMERNVIYLSESQTREDIPAEPKELTWRVEVDVTFPGNWAAPSVCNHVMAKLNKDEWLGTAEIVSAHPLWEKDRR